jgi:hypothetical protein
LPRSPSSLKPIEIRKQLLIAEAEVLRTQLGKDLATLQQGFNAMEEQAKSVLSVASIATTVVAGFSAFRRARQTQSNGKSSVLSTLLNSARAAATVWQALRSRQR